MLVPPHRVKALVYDYLTLINASRNGRRGIVNALLADMAFPRDVISYALSETDSNKHMSVYKALLEYRSMIQDLKEADSNKHFSFYKALQEYKYKIRVLEEADRCFSINAHPENVDSRFCRCM